MTTTTDPAESYMHSILGQQNPLEIQTGEEPVGQLLRVDWLWNVGRGDEAKKLLRNLPTCKQEHPYFYGGLEALILGNLSEAYDLFLKASKNSSGLHAVFFGERAVNIAFWMACSGKMLEAGQDLKVDTVPYAGGVQAFCQHMNGQHKEAEKTARNAMAAGFRDPWTLHAIAHSLYSQGRLEECVQFLDDHRDHIQSCNPSAFMKGHLEFHQALCFIALKDESKLDRLIQGPLWKNLPNSEKKDYWNATGLLNVHWKAELNGLVIDRRWEDVDEALNILQPTANPSKSPVFSLCILRWSKGKFRIEWKDKLCKSDNPVLVATARAVDMLYPDATTSSLTTSQCKSAQEILSPISKDLVKLGASPEQREVVEDFLSVVKNVSRQ